MLIKIHFIQLKSNLFGPPDTEPRLTFGPPDSSDGGGANGGGDAGGDGGDDVPPP